MTNKVFRVASWLAVAASAMAAISAATVLIVGVLALTGRTTYPVSVDLGPVHLHQGISMAVGLNQDVCQSASVATPDESADCAAFFVHRGTQGESATRTQDAAVQPQVAALAGRVDLATTGGWDGFVAATIAYDVLKLVLLSAFLFLLWRLLAASAAGAVFADRSVRWVRGMGWILITAAVFDAVQSVLISPLKWGYSVEAFGPAPHLYPSADANIDITQIALGALVLLLAEVFRRGTAVEAENRLTV